MKGPLEGKVAVVTGGARGIGREIASTFARAGCDVAIADLIAGGLVDVSREIQGLGRRVLDREVDISRSADVRSFLSDVEQRLGRIDIVVNNAAYIHYGPFLEFPEAEWEKVMATSLKGVFLVGQAGARAMAGRRQGTIINLASVAGEVGVPMGSAYCAAKGGVIALTRVMALELAAYGIRVNAIAPYATDTENARRVVGDEGMKLREALVPLGRLAKIQDVAQAALFLASEDSGYITGHVLNVDGGFMAARVAVK
ncbi:MAG: SDR family NAD(P)-dependent oxidoreductase [bacterium]